MRDRGRQGLAALAVLGLWACSAEDPDAGSGPAMNLPTMMGGSSGLGGSGAAWEARFWGQNKKIVIAEKANIDRSGAVAQGLYAINCYMGTRWGENNPEDHVRYARIDLMGLVREDLLFDMARHVDSTVHQFEEW